MVANAIWRSTYHDLSELDGEAELMAILAGPREKKPSVQ
jgi:hypothetical protein